MNVAREDTKSRPHDVQRDDLVVERARELLTQWFEISAADGEQLLRTWSRQTGTPIYTLAAALISDIFEGRPTGCSARILRHLEHSLRRLPYAGMAHLGL